MNDSMHLFAGGGGGLIGDLIVGHNPICAVEWTPYACAILRERAAEGWFPDLHVYEGDIRMFNPSEYAGRIHTLCAGFPCTDISVAGRQDGIGEETRSGLYREVLRVADVVRPREIFMENVTAIISLRQKLTLICLEKVRQWDLFGAQDNESVAGRYIRRVIEAKYQAALGFVLGDLASRGYDAKWICLRASDVGANHHRDRWWLLARRGDELSHTELRGTGWWEQQQECVEKASNNNGDTNINGESTCTQHDESQRMQSDAGNIPNSKEERFSAGRVGSWDAQNGKILDMRVTDGSDYAGNICHPKHNGQPTAEECGSVEQGGDHNEAWTQQAIESARSGEQCADVANTQSAGGNGLPIGTKTEIIEHGSDGSNISDTASLGQSGQRPHEQSINKTQAGNWEADRAVNICEAGQSNGKSEPSLCGMDDGLAYRTLQSWWEVEPNVGRTTEDCKDRAAQLIALGNGQVPLQAAVAYKILERIFDADA